MKLTLQGHSELYAVEQLMMQLFPEEAEGEDTRPTTVCRVCNAKGDVAARFGPPCGAQL